ncbi:hypothetical protein BSK59_13655 [Paenibacillus odorifer]|uniref:hypothetical protein n=1 Tax=Paenibacillus odorifer TaxID=189426 RepID=UPI00096ED6E8|nr:hypothetical protein [Paenibacillus odorifer]OME55517.1 hypothetical protein BSK59_13655 [Paenibacillus odorifer]
MTKYTWLKKHADSIGHKWELDGVLCPQLEDAHLLKALNFAAKSNYELVCKEDENTYIMRYNW